PLAGTCRSTRGTTPGSCQFPRRSSSERTGVSASASLIPTTESAWRSRSFVVRSNMPLNERNASGEDDGNDVRQWHLSLAAELPPPTIFDLCIADRLPLEVRNSVGSAVAERVDVVLDVSAGRAAVLPLRLVGAIGGFPFELFRDSTYGEITGDAKGKVKVALR